MGVCVCVCARVRVCMCAQVKILGGNTRCAYMWEKGNKALAGLQVQLVYMRTCA